MEAHDPHIVPNCSGEMQPTENTVPVRIMQQPSHGRWWPLFWPTKVNSVPTAYMHSPVSVMVGRRVPRLLSCTYNIQYTCCPHCEDSVQGINKTNRLAATPRPVCKPQSVTRHSANASWTWTILHCLHHLNVTTKTTKRLLFNDTQPFGYYLTLLRQGGRVVA